jgi:hypothetical protein
MEKSFQLKMKRNNVCELCKSEVDYKFIQKGKFKHCKFCNMIFTMNIEMTKYFVLCISSMNQYDIINKTIDYYKKNKKYPHIHLIDEDAKDVNISLLEYISFNDLIDSEIKNTLKIFIPENISYPLSPVYDENDYEEEFQIIDGNHIDDEESINDTAVIEYENYIKSLIIPEISDGVEKEIIDFNLNDNLESNIKIYNELIKESSLKLKSINTYYEIISNLL